MVEGTKIILFSFANLAICFYIMFGYLYLHCECEKILGFGLNIIDKFSK